MAKLSVCMIVKNEEKNIAGAIQNSWGFADEIIVVDTGSSDNTRSIADSLGARTFFHEWKNDFAAARNESIKHATGDWFFWMDADDRISDNSINEIKKLKEGARDCFYGFTLRNISPVNQKFIGDESCMHARLFPRIPEIKFENRIHEQATQSALRAGLRIVSLPNIIIEHHGYKDPKIVAEKLKRNISILLIDMGFPAETVFTTFHISGYNCFYAPNVLTIWDNNEFVGLCDPFELGLPDSQQKQTEILYTHALEIIRHYQKQKNEYSNTSLLIAEEIKRMEKLVAKAQEVII